MPKFSKSDAGAQPETAVPSSLPKKRRVLPVHPFLFAVFPILALLAQNVEKIPLHQIFAPLGTILLGTVTAWLGFLLMTRYDRRAAIAVSIIALLSILYFYSLLNEHPEQSVLPPFTLPALALLFSLMVGTQRPFYDGKAIRKAALAASISILLFFSVGHITDLLPNGMHGLVLPACVIALIALLFVIARTRQPLYDMTSVLNLAAVVLIAPSCWAIATEIGNTHSHSAGVYTKGNDIVAGAQPTKTVNRHLSNAPQDVPDVYYIILDAYGRADRLQTYYGYDNTPFLQELEKRGFFIARQSEANYNQTPLCLASALSMNYLEATRGQKLTPQLLQTEVDDNAVINYLRKRGYHYIDVASGLEESRVDTADVVLNDSPDLSTLEGNMMGLTAFGAMAAHQRKRYDHHRARLNGGFDNVAKAAALPYPKFVFTHILAPHPPFVFDANGGAVNPGGPLTFADASELLQLISKDEYRKRYIAQLQYINKRAIEAIDAILKQSKHRPIIIIQGDHGSRMNLDWKSLAKTDIREPFSNLNAYLVPDNVRHDLTEKITAVNSFRIILTDAFGANYPRLPDRNYYSTENEPYDFKDITAQLAQVSGDTGRPHVANSRARRSSGKASLAARKKVASR